MGKYHPPKKPANSVGKGDFAKSELDDAKKEIAKHTGKYYGGMVPLSKLPPK